MSASPAAAEAGAANKRFWTGIATLPEEAQKSFWDAGVSISRFIGENPNPRTLTWDTSQPPAGAAWWERALFYIGQSHHNQAVADLQMGESMIDGAQWLLSALQGDFNKNPTTGQIVTGGLISMIPIVDQVCDVRDIVANCLDLDSDEAREDPEKWMALGMSCFGLIPEIGSAVKTVAKAAMKKGVRFLELLKHMEWVEKNFKRLKMGCPWGFAPIDWLRKFDWVGHARQAASFAKKAFEDALAKTQAALRYAVGAIKARLHQLAELFRAVLSRIVAAMEELGRRIKSKIDELLGGAKKEAGNYDATPGGPNKHGQGDKEPPKTPRPPSNYAPPLKSRHSIRGVRQGGVKKAKNTVAEPHIDMNADVAAINRGEGARNGNHFTVNGRTYELTNGDHLVPHSGPGFHDLDRGEFGALGVFNKFGDTAQAREYARSLAGPEQVKRALDVWRLGQ